MDDHQQNPTKSAPVDEYRVLWTANKTQKLKKWHDGFLRYHSFNRRMLVYDDSRHLVADMYLRDRESLGEGDQLDFEHHLVSLEDFTGSVNQDLTPIFSPAVQRRKAAAASPAHTPVPDRQRPPTAIARNGMPNSHIPREHPPQNWRPQTPVPVRRLNRGMSVSHMDTPKSMWSPARPPIVYPAQRQEQPIPRQNRMESPAQNQAQAWPVSERKVPNARPVGGTPPPASRRPPPRGVGIPSVSHPHQAQPRPGAVAQERERSPFRGRHIAAAHPMDHGHNPPLRLPPPVPQYRQTEQVPAVRRDRPAPQPNDSPDHRRHSPPLPSRISHPDQASESAPEPAVGAASALSKIRQFGAPPRGRPPRQPTTPIPPPLRPAAANAANSPLGREDGSHQVSRSPSPEGAKQQANRQAGHQQAGRSISIRDSRTPSPPQRPRQRANNPAQLTFHQRPNSPNLPPNRRAPAPQRKPNKRNSPTTPAAPPPASKRQQTTNPGQFRSARTFHESSQADELEEAEDDEKGPPRGFGLAIPTATLKLSAGGKKTLLCSRPPNFRFSETKTESGRRQPPGPRARPEIVVDDLSDGWDGYNG